MELSQYISIRDIWAWLIIKGYKTNENRPYQLPPYRINKATALQVSATKYKESHTYYKLPQVSYYLEKDPETKGKSHHELDAYFKKYYHGKVIGIIVFNGSYTIDTIPIEDKDPHFFNVPEISDHNWVISNVISLDIVNQSNPIYLSGQVCVCDFKVIEKDEHYKVVSEIIKQLQRKKIFNIVNSKLNTIKNSLKIVSLLKIFKI